MPFTVTATQLTNATETSTSGTPAVNVAKRLVSDTTIDLTAANKFDEIREAAFGKPMSPLGTISDAQVLGQHRLRATQITPVQGAENKVFDCVGRYDSMYTWAESTTPAVTGQLVLPVEVELDGSPRQVLMYRSEPAAGFTVQPAADLNTTTDIGGTKCDENGKPVVALVPSLGARVSLILDSSRSSGSAKVSVHYDYLQGMINKWNNAAFLWWSSANQVYCESGSISHIRDEYYRITYNLRWDAWYGCEQLPSMDASGKHKPDNDARAHTVYWRSLKRGTSNFSLMFTGQPNTTTATNMAMRGHWLSVP